MINLGIIKEIEEIESFEERVYRAALYYVSIGMYVLPLEIRGKKLNSRGINYSSVTKKPESVTRWFGPGGTFRGCNVGIACGMRDGVFVVDIDAGIDKRGKAKQGDKTLEMLYEKYGTKLEGPSQKTPGGGYHHLFKWVPNARSSTDKIGKDIDTRGGDETSCKGHIVVWPSVVEIPIEGEPEEGQEPFNLVEYRWETGGEIENPPAWVIDSLGESWGKGSAGLGNENMDNSDFESSYSIRQIGNMIKDIDMESITYDEWLWVGQAIHSQHPNAKGLELWDRWSKRGERYEPRECQIRWDNFKEEGTIRIGTLIHIARKYGEYDPRTQGKDVIDLEDIGDEIDVMNREFAVTVVGGSVRVIQECKPNALDPLAERYRFLDRTGFLTLMENQKIAVTDNKGNVKLLNKGAIWLQDERRRTYPGGIAFMPGHDKEMNGALNMWQGWPISDKKEDAGDWGLFKWHIKNILCKGNMDMYNWVMDWMADIIQNPTEPKGSCIVLSGQEGTGKGTFCHTLGKLVGNHYKHVTDEEHLIGRFNGHMHDAIFVFADEVTYGGSKKTAGKLKSLVTEPVLMAERKGIDATRYMNYVRLAIASNESWFIPAGPTSRRWLVIEIDNSKANDLTYFNAIRNQMENEGGYEGLMHHLRHREIKSNLRYAPVTAKLKQQRSVLAVQNSVVEWWAFCCEMGHIDGIIGEHEFSPGEENDKWQEGNVPTVEMYAAYEQWAVEKRVKRFALNIFTDTMESMGIHKSRRRMGNNERKMVFIVPNLTDAISLLESKGGVTL